MADVFLSYAREDRSRLESLVRCIESAGLSVFWDREIPPGMTWREVLDNELRAARCVLVVQEMVRLTADLATGSGHYLHWEPSSQAVLANQLTDLRSAIHSYNESCAALIEVCAQTCDDFHNLTGDASVEIKLGCKTLGPD